MSHYGGYAPQPRYGAPPQQGYPGQPQSGYPGQPNAGYPGQPRSGYPGQPHSQGAPYGGPPQPGYHGTPPGVDPTVMSWFRAVDQDGSGQINASELSRALANGQQRTFSEETCRLMIAMFDQDRSGSINLTEFGHLFNFINQWTDMYRQADQDRTGTINEAELASCLQRLGYRLSPQFIGLLVYKFSPQNRQIGLDHFILLNIHLHRLTEAFKQRDREMKGVISIGYEDFLNVVITSIM